MNIKLILFNKFKKEMLKPLRIFILNMLLFLLYQLIGLQIICKFKEFIPQIIHVILIISVVHIVFCFISSFFVLIYNNYHERKLPGYFQFIGLFLIISILSYLFYCIQFFLMLTSAG